MNILRTISRIILGLLFIFSGFVKGVDPIGTQYRIIDYFIAYHTNWAIPSALYLSIFLCMFEFLMGALVLLNVRVRLVSWLVLLMMIFFTLTTFYDALYNPVPDCGCFGDAIKLTNWQTFYKNIVIMVFVGIFFYDRNIIKPTFTAKGEFIVTLIVILVFLGFERHNLRHLPLIDFTSWKAGTKLAPDNPKPIQYFLTYTNKQTNKPKEFLSSDTVWKDSVNWKLMPNSTRIVDPNPKGPDIVIEDKDRNNLTDNIIRNPDFNFILVAYDLSNTNKKAFKKVNEFFKQSYANGHSFIILTSSLPEEIDKFRKEFNIDENIEFLFADDTTLKAMIRSNPGLILLKKAEILKKWHYNDMPEYLKVKEKLIK